MATIAPFRALRYNSSRIRDIGRVVSPPYDVISPEEKEAYQSRHLYNITRLTLPEQSPEGYREAGELFSQWQRERILVRDEEPSLYPYQQVFTPPGERRKKVRWGVIAVVRLEPEVILSHERTMGDPVQDRFRLLKATRAQLSQIFALFSDPDRRIEGILREFFLMPPVQEFVDDEGTLHRIWRMEDGELISRVCRLMREKRLLIADGHHRFKAALRYRELMRSLHPTAPPNASFEFATMYLTSMDSEGLVILPTHRLISRLDDLSSQEIIHRLGRFFELKIFVRGEEDRFMGALKKGEGMGLVIYGNRSHFLLKLRQGQELLPSVPPEIRHLDATVVDEFILKELFPIGEGRVSLGRDREEVIRAVSEGRYQMAFLLRPPMVEEIRRVARAGLVMPRKSTFFYPKVATGVAIYPMSSQEEIYVPA